MHLRLLQAAQWPWLVNTFEHALLHALKAAGRLCGIVDDYDHALEAARVRGSDSEGDFRAEAFAAPAAVAPFVADLVTCALKLARELPSGAFDLEAAVVARMRQKGILPPEEDGDAAAQIAAATRQAEELVDGAKLSTLDEARRFAVAWVETALQHARNEDYWRGRTERAEGKAAEAWRELAAEQERSAGLRRELGAAATDLDGVWMWMGDGSDEPGSLTCAVVMRAERLRALLAGRAPVLPSTAGGPLERGEWRVAPTDDGGAMVRVGEVTAEGVRIHYPDGACDGWADATVVEGWERTAAPDVLRRLRLATA